MAASPLETYRSPVLPGWIDYNGHMNVGYYVVAFDQGTDGLFNHLDIGAGYRVRASRTLYVLEAHLTYERELKEGDRLLVTTQLVEADAKRLHVFHRMMHAEEGFLAATNELMFLHVDLAGPRAAPFPEDAARRIAGLLEMHRSLPAPPQLGRSIRMRR